MEDIIKALLGLGVALALFLCFALALGAIGGLIVITIWNAFHLANIVHLTYWQAIGVYFIFYAPAAGAGAASSNFRNQKKK